jgi:hypothetical protein
VTQLRRSELDQHMHAFLLYRDEGWTLDGIGKLYHVDPKNVRTWITGLGGEIRKGGGHKPGNTAALVQAMHDRREDALPEGKMLCACCDVIADSDDSGLCPDCRGEESERETEIQAECALFSDSAFLDNRRNVGRFDPALYHNTRTVIPIW